MLNPNNRIPDPSSQDRCVWNPRAPTVWWEVGKKKLPRSPTVWWLVGTREQPSTPTLTPRSSQARHPYTEWWAGDLVSNKVEGEGQHLRLSSGVYLLTVAWVLHTHTHTHTQIRHCPKKGLLFCPCSWICPHTKYNVTASNGPISQWRSHVFTLSCGVIVMLVCARTLNSVFTIT